MSKGKILKSLDELSNVKNNTELFNHIKKLDDLYNIKGLNKGQIARGICGQENWIKLTNNQVPEGNGLSNESLIQRIKNKIDYINSGYDHRDYRLRNKKEENKNNITLENAVRVVFDVIYKDVQDAATESILRNSPITSDMEEKVSLARQLVIVFPELDE